MDRRDFLKTAAITGLVAGTGLPAIAGNKESSAYDVVAVKDGEPEAMFKKGIEAMGGMSQFVKPGQTVVVKPNIGWAKTPDIGANTNPALVAEIVKECLKAGASKVSVFDHTCNNWKYCYRDSGIEAAAKAAGAVVMPGNARKNYREVKVEKGKILKSAEVHELILDSDVFINVPILKNHGGATMTCAMKNLMGIIWDRRYWHQNGLPQCIADFTTFRAPDLNIVDAYRVMYKYGPRGPASPNAAIEIKKQLLLSTNMVSVDTLAALILRMKPEKIKYLAIAAEMGLGSLDYKKYNIKKLEA